MQDLKEIWSLILQLAKVLYEQHKSCTVTYTSKSSMILQTLARKSLFFLQDWSMYLGKEVLLLIGIMVEWVILVVLTEELLLAAGI